MNAPHDHTPPRTAVMPVMTMEEIVLPTEAERAEMLASLKAAEQQIACGEFAEHNPADFVERLMNLRAAALATKPA